MTQGSPLGVQSMVAVPENLSYELQHMEGAEKCIRSSKGKVPLPIEEARITSARHITKTKKRSFRTVLCAKCYLRRGLKNLPHLVLCLVCVPKRLKLQSLLSMLPAQLGFLLTCAFVEGSRRQRLRSRHLEAKPMAVRLIMFLTPGERRLGLGKAPRSRQMLVHL